MMFSDKITIKSKKFVRSKPNIKNFDTVELTLQMPYDVWKSFRQVIEVSIKEISKVTTRKKSKRNTK